MPPGATLDQMHGTRKERAVPFTFFVYLIFLFIQDSLAAEIEGTMRKELQMDDPDVEEQKYVHRVFFI